MKFAGVVLLGSVVTAEYIARAGQVRVHSQSVSFSFCFSAFWEVGLDWGRWVSTAVCPGGASQVVLVVKNPPASVGDVLRDTGSIPGLGRSPGGGHGNPPQDSLAWGIPWTGALQSLGSRRAKHD